MSSHPEALLGIDVGTTNVKAALFLPNGSLHAVNTQRLPVIRPQPGWEEYDPEELFAHTAKTVKTLLADLKEPIHIAGVAVASMAETAVALDKQGQALHHAVAWHDQRSLPQAQWWRQSFGAEAVYTITGLPPAYIFGVNKLMWLRENAPEAFAKTVCWLNVADYIAYRLCGVQATDYSLASRLMLLDLRQGTWSDVMLEACGLSADLFAPLVKSGSYLGGVHAEAAAATGLAQGTAVVSGGHDHPCGAFALGITRPGDVLDSMGTSESIFSIVEAPKLEASLAQTGYQQGFHVVADSYYVNGGLYTSGRCIEWLKDLLEPKTDDPYAELIRLASAAPAASRGLMFLPHLRMANTPIDDPHSRGAFIGLSIGSTRECMARALFEGLAYEAQVALDGLAELFDIRAKRVRAIGGGSRNPLLMVIKATLLGEAIDVFAMDEATSLGAAMLAGLGAGVYSSVDEAIETVRVPASQVAPDAVLQETYKQRYQKVYQKLYYQLKPLYHQLASLEEDV